MKAIQTRWAVVAAVLALAPAAPAAAGESPDSTSTLMTGSPLSITEPRTGLFDGPIGVGFFSADYAVGRRALGRTEVGLGILGNAIIDTPDFYGALAGGALLYGSYALSDKLEVFGSLEAVKVEYVQNASLKALQYGLGQATAGATYTVYRQGGMALSPSGRVMLPTDFSSPNVRTVGLELGVAGNWTPTWQLELHGYLGGDLSAGLSAAPALPRPGLLATAGAQYSFVRWFGVALDVNAHLGAQSYVAPALALRAAIGHSLGIELGATLPLLGNLRHLGAGGLRVAWRM